MLDYLLDFVTLKYMDEGKLREICKKVRYEILVSTTNAGSGHPTSSLSAVELLTTLFFRGFFDKNDKFLLSKGHAAPLLYALYSALGVVPSDWVNRLRKFGSPYEGHPVPKLDFIDVAAGSLGQGLSVGVGMALGVKLRIKNKKLKIKREPKIWVLLGDSEMAEGQVWEAMEIAAYYKLNNLIAIIDVNRLGQYGETEEGWDIYNYEKKARAFGWETIIIENGHVISEIYRAFKKVSSGTHASKPKMVIAKTIKGKGVSFLENKENWHGKTLDKKELRLAIKELDK